MTCRVLAAALAFVGFPCVASVQELPPLRDVQARLKSLGYYRGDLDGLPGSQTAAAIRRFQLARNLKVTGELNPQTLSSLGFALPSPTPPDPFFSGGPLATASAQRRREVILLVQKFLAKEGLYSGPRDGVAGPNTRAAVRAWQERVGIPFKGRLDTGTLARMGIL